MIYETKGLALEQVDELYGTVTKAWKSQSFVPSVTFQEVEQIRETQRGLSFSDMAQVAERKRSIDHVEKNQDDF